VNQRVGGRDISVHGQRFFLVSTRLPANVACVSSRWMFLLAILAIVPNGRAGEPVRLRLNNGAEIRGELLRERADGVLVDLGFSVLAVPITEIAAREAVTPTAATPLAESRSEDLYHVEPGRDPLPVDQNVERVGGAVVQIQTASGLGSGFIINKLGHVITNQHVIAGEREISVIVYQKAGGGLEKRVFPKVKIVAMNGFLDLAVLQIEDPAAAELPFVPIGDSDALSQGQPVFAIGSPLGLERTVSQGIVSVRARDTRGAWSIQSTTQINPGNSGGPLFNARGEVVGINNMKLAGVGVEGLGFSIPANLLKLFLKNRDAFAFDPRNPNSGFRYLSPPAPAAADPKPNP
jgi:serine protease Do